MNSNENLNWVDPDIVTEMGEDASFDAVKEREFKEFFVTGWLDPKHDDLREKWDPMLSSESSHGRLMAKVALWSVVQLRAIRERLES